jgi:hypothetical protein
MAYGRYVYLMSMRFDGGGVVVFVVIVTALLQASRRVLDPLPVFHSRMNRNFGPYLARSV